MATYEATLRVRLNPESATVFLDRGIKTSTLTASDAEEVLALALKSCKDHGARLDRWTFYVPGLNEKLKGAKDTLDPKAVAKVADEDGSEIRITLGKFGKPKMIIGQPLTPNKRKSKFIDLA